MMALSTVTLGFATAELVRRAAGSQAAGTAPAALWIALVCSFLLFSLGGAISGSTFLALIYDRAAEHQRGRAVGWSGPFCCWVSPSAASSSASCCRDDESAGAIAFSARFRADLFIVTAVALLSSSGSSRFWARRARARASATQAEKQPPACAATCPWCGAAARCASSWLLSLHVYGFRLPAGYGAGALRRASLRHGGACHQSLRRLLGQHGDSGFLRHTLADAPLARLQSFQHVAGGRAGACAWITSPLPPRRLPARSARLVTPGLILLGIRARHLEYRHARA